MKCEEIFRNEEYKKIAKEKFKFFKKKSEIIGKTHFAMRHLDEITFAALFIVFVNKNFKIERVPHQTPVEQLEDADIVFDIGKKYDGLKWFDHHQFNPHTECPKSAAGLGWEFIKAATGINIPKIDRLVELIDKHDCGIQAAGEFELPSVFAVLNANDVYSKEQDEGFWEDVQFMVRYIRRIVENHKKEQEAEEIIKNSKTLNGEGLPQVLELSKFTPFWSKFINGKKTGNSIEVVIWEDKNPNQEVNWYAQVVPLEPEGEGRMKRVGIGLMPDDKMFFVHKSHFIAGAKEKNTLIEYLQNQFKNQKK